jgi:hypothetical protein
MATAATTAPLALLTTSAAGVHDSTADDINAWANGTTLLVRWNLTRSSAQVG